MLRLFSSGPKSRTRAAYLAIFLGWTGTHKFYLGYRNAGMMHAALTGAGAMVLVVQGVAPASAIPASIVAWLVILIGYFYIRRVHFGHTIAQIINPGRLLLWPLRLLRYTFQVSRVGYRIRGEEEQRRRWRRRWRGRRYRGDDDNDGCSFGLVLMILGIILCLAVVVAIVVVCYIIFSLVGYLALAASVTIGVIEGVIYLRKSDDRFERDYVSGRRPWF